MCSDAMHRRGGRRTRMMLVGLVVLGIVVMWAAGVGAQAGKVRFFPDDPIALDDDRALDAGGAKPFELGNLSNFIENTFLSPGDRSAQRALNVNTVDEVPDSSWFTNRIGRRSLSIDEIVRGPDRVDRLRTDRWQIVGGKSTGFQPGFRAVDPADPSALYQLEFDAAGNSELATGAEVIGTAIYHAIGFNVVDVHLTEIDPSMVTIAPTATTRDGEGGRRPFVQADLDALFRDAARLPNGRYRVLASRFAEGQSMGQFRYYGTRPDDPNDIYPHEHRRELRANRVFCAWLNHDDSRANNTLDMLVGPEGRRYIKHYMFDFGSILGSGTQFADNPRSGHEYIIDRGPAVRTLLSLGLYVRPWLLKPETKAPPAVGRFDAERFEPARWKPEYPNTAFDNMRPDDAFWGARIVAAFSDAAIQAVVRKASYTDPAATEHMSRALIARRDVIARTWLNGVNPIFDAELSADRRLRFRNAAVDAGAATPAESYVVAWSRFDNATDTHEPAGGEQTVQDLAASAPPGLLSAAGFVSATIRGQHPQHARWADPVRVYFKNDGSGWKTVGLERTDLGTKN
jgi:hypothetical protein